MVYKVLVVDDSNFFQHRLKEMINEHPQLEVVGIANNGRMAVEKAAHLKPDIITMDFEMPVMDGVTAVRHIMADNPTPILMFSSLTYEGARITFDALDAGAVDFLPKDFAEVSKNSASLKKRLHENLLAIVKPAITSSAVNPAVPDSESYPRASPSPVASSRTANATRPADRSMAVSGSRLLAIGASTGGPVALAEVLKVLPENFPLPIVLVQHMPENFTKAFSERLNRQCNIEVREASDGDILKPGLALLAPGGKQMMLDKRGSYCVRIIEGNEKVNYKPSVDITFGSAANVFGRNVLAVILTGMGTDGCEGARMLKQSGAIVWSQDKDSSIIYGMPMAVARAGLTDKVLSLKDIGSQLIREC